MATTRSRDDEERGGSALDTLINIALKPIRPFVSRTALRGYLTTILLFLTSLVLLGFAITAYILFYWSYIPRISFERTIHLQFDDVYDHPLYTSNGVAQGIESGGGAAHPYPYGTVDLRPDIVGQQGYDVVIELTLPRTPDNTDAGNFMLETTMYAPMPDTSSILDFDRSRLNRTVLARSRRPAILPYRSPAVETAYKLTELPWYLLGLRQETDSLRITMFERISFRAGYRTIPATMKVELQSTRRLQVYTARAHFRARFVGLRWLMYNHRIISALIFIPSFWVTEMIFCGLAWATLVFIVFPRTPEVKAQRLEEVAEKVKTEVDHDAASTPMKMSDTERNLPTYGTQQPLRYEPGPRIKSEGDEEGSTIVVPEHVIKAAEADVESEDDEDFFVDSGLGTGLESGSTARRESMRRRRGRSGVKVEDVQ